MSSTSSQRIGGFSLGLERAGMRTVAFCEINPFSVEARIEPSLANHWPGVPCYDDVRTLTADRLRADGISVDVICGGFPCQDISVAGRGAGIAGERSGLWSEYARLIGEVRPGFVIVENVARLLSDGMGRVLGDLAALRYDAEWEGLPAYAVGSPQERDRIWIVAYSNERKLENGRASPIRRRSAGAGESSRIGSAANRDTLRELQPGWCFTDFRRWPVYGAQGSDRWRENWRDRLMSLCRVDDGVSRRLDETKGLGNAVVPQIPEIIGRAIMSASHTSGDHGDV
jgi:DNA (cytosine-5)-methyltransferase 1